MPNQSYTAAGQKFLCLTRVRTHIVMMKKNSTLHSYVGISSKLYNYTVFDPSWSYVLHISLHQSARAFLSVCEILQDSTQINIFSFKWFRKILLTLVILQPEDALIAWYVDFVSFYANVRFLSFRNSSWSQRWPLHLLYDFFKVRKVSVSSPYTNLSAFVHFCFNRSCHNVYMLIPFFARDEITYGKMFRIRLCLTNLSFQ